MVFTVEITEAAWTDIEEAFLWLWEKTHEHAISWQAELLETIESLAHHPERCALAPQADSLEVEIRQLLLGKHHGTYRVIFRIHENTVQVIRVRHAVQTSVTEEL